MKSIITGPSIGEAIPTGACVVEGAAWSGEDEVVGVDVSTDGGKTWGQAHLLPRSGYSWYRWEYPWEVRSAGSYVLMSRATNARGETQPMDFPNKWDGLGYGNNMVFPHAVEVRDA